VSTSSLDKVTIISGGAKGADHCAEKTAKHFKVPIDIHPADWDKFGKSAGYIRNKEMLALGPDVVMAFWDGKSKGTQNTINGARDRKITTFIYYY